MKAETARKRPFNRGMGTKGFTLLEVMISLSIVAGLLVTLIYSLNYHMDVAIRQEAVTVGEMLAIGKMDELRQSRANSSGVFGEPYSDYSYTCRVKPSYYPGISEVSVTVVKDKERVVLRELVRRGS